jgi:hypothetical protein
VGSVIAFLIKVVNYVFFSIVRGIVSLLSMAAAMHIWTRVNRCRGTWPARPTSLLYFPIVAAAVFFVFFVAATIRFMLNISAGLLAQLFVITIIVFPGGIAAGFLTGARAHLYRTRWGRVMMESTANHLIFWSASAVLAVFFQILPYGWLAAPTAGLLLFASFQLITANLILYARAKRLERAAARAVAGPVIVLAFDARGAAVVSCLADLWARSPGASIPAQTLAAALSNGDRLKNDFAFLLMPAVEQAWREMAEKREALDETLRKLVADGVLKDGLAPGSALARLFAIGAFTRTVTLAHARFAPDGVVARQEHVVLAEAGGANLLLSGTGESLSLREVKAPDLLGLAARLAGFAAGPRG